MAHTIRFENFEDFCLLSKEEIIDLIELLFRGGDRKFVIYADEKQKKFLGQESYSAWANEHKILLSQTMINKTFCRGLACGGNLKAPNVKIAAAMVLAHELQHANQSLIHKDSSIFYGNLGGVNAKGKPRMKRYRGRACEREAREFADEKLSDICAYFNVPIETRKRTMTQSESEINDLVEIFSECDEVSMDDIKEELRASKILSPGNVMLVKQELAEMGIKVTT